MAPGKDRVTTGNRPEKEKETTMNKFHSTMTRRDFMKALGVSAAGLGAAGAAAPVFHDLDEMMSSTTSLRKRPWWVKEVDEPTVEIDWNLMQREPSQTTQSRALLARYYGKDVVDAWGLPDETPKLQANEPGYTLKDFALSDANGASGSVSYDRDEAGHLIVSRGDTPTERGVPKWSGSPEEANKLLRAAMVFAGAADIGTGQIDEHHKKLICLTGQNVSTSYFPYEGYNTWPAPDRVVQPIEFSADDTVYRMDSSTGINYVPSGAPVYDVCYSVPQDAELNLRRPTMFGQVAQTRYRLRTNIQYMTFTFLKGLGYWADSLPYRGYPDQSGAVLSGLNEASRHTLMSISPDFGAFMGMFSFVTNFPLEHTHPIDAGIWKFCQSCGVCADNCPSNSIEKKGGRDISFEPPPSAQTPKHPPLPGWKAEAEYHKLGCKRYWTDMVTCTEFIRNQSRCFQCWGICTFNGASDAMIHDVVRATAATTSIFNSFFARMHVAFGYGLKEGDEIEDWWDMSLPSYGFDSAKLAHKKY
jgi:reductive dehalogenase